MSIGLYDQDMATYTLVPFNLELMKLSAYYKKKREVVVLSPYFTPERHQKFHLRKDFDDGNFIMGIEKIPNLEYGGYALQMVYMLRYPKKQKCCTPILLYMKIWRKLSWLPKGATRKKFFKT